MTDHEHNNDPVLEAELERMTAWEGDAPELWRDAMEVVENDETSTRRMAWMHSPWVGRIAAVVMLVLLVSVIVVWSLPTADSIRQAAAVPDTAHIQSEEALHDRHFGTPRLALAEGFTGAQHKNLDKATKDIRFASTDADSAEGERYVARSASLELHAEDVRATFLRLTYLVSEARGEYVQESALVGEDENVQANVTLRIDAARLSDVLNEIRSLAAVVSESVSGDDVTGQYVDLESRLRNERRVEEELLELLDQRDDAPLKEVLELRRELGDVRGSIERMQGQLDRLSHIVSLARVLVIVRPTPVEIAPEPEPEPEPEATLGDIFLDRVGNAWHDGLVALVQTIAGAVQILVGGLVWWVIFTALLVVVMRKLRRKPGQPGTLAT